MRGSVIFKINCLYFYLFHPNMIFLYRKKHLCLILKTLALNLTHKRKILIWYCPQSCLCIGYLNSAEEPEHQTCTYISDSALPWHIILCEITAAQYDFVLALKHFFRTRSYILDGMLIISVNGDYSRCLFPVINNIREGRLKRPSLAFVDFMCQQCNLLMCGCLTERLKMSLITPVIYKNYIFKACT